MPSGIYKHKLLSLENKQKISNSMKGKSSVWLIGRKLSKITKRKISKNLIGVNTWSKGKKPWNKGISFSKETRKRMSKSRMESELCRGKNHYNWKGGISNNPYPKKFNCELKLKIRIRDNFTCCLCGRTEREELEELNRVLCINHKDFNKNNCEEKNLNTLCLRCNVKINRERGYWINYFNGKE